MSTSFFFLQATKTVQNSQLLDALEKWATEGNVQTYVIDRPLGDNKYSYAYNRAFVLLIPKRKITFINFSADTASFNTFVEDFIEDLGSISDKYRYKNAIGRPRAWRDDLILKIPDGTSLDISTILLESAVDDPEKQRVSELLISLLTGSINDIERVRVEIPQSRLEKVKRKIQLFDADQTRFVYHSLEKKVVRIQGLSGTGKTELLLHKLKELYVAAPDAKIALTCHNRILAENLRHRIPDFFNFMKVEQQIKWNDRLWCSHAWGSAADIHSGIYSYICNFYQTHFQRWSILTSFDKACTDAKIEIEKQQNRSFAFQYILIDESQDFPESFIDLCSLVTEKVVYVAGDIFQSIFDESITPSISPDFLLSKCYRTDPKTLMFAHAAGMGLFEERKLRWLEDDEWRSCGYIVNNDKKSGEYLLGREPLRRFEDIDDGQTPSVNIMPITDNFSEESISKVLAILAHIIESNPSVTPDDIGIILLDTSDRTYELADKLQQVIPRQTSWPVNIAYETKQKMPKHLFVSNRNNVKGLEFPFVICITENIRDSYSYRNTLYMTLTRSFLQTYVIVSNGPNTATLSSLEKGLSIINKENVIRTTPPSDSEKKRIRTAIMCSKSNVSFFDFVTSIFDTMSIPKGYRQDLLDILKKTIGEDFDVDNVRETIDFNYRKMRRGPT